jgi:hypothetical protein
MVQITNMIEATHVHYRFRQSNFSNFPNKIFRVGTVFDFYLAQRQP